MGTREVTKTEAGRGLKNCITPIAREVNPKMGTIQNLTHVSPISIEAEATRQAREDMTRTTREITDPVVEVGVGVMTGQSHLTIETPVILPNKKRGRTPNIKTNSLTKLRMVTGYISAIYAHTLTLTDQNVRPLVSGKAQTRFSFGVR